MLAEEKHPPNEAPARTDKSVSAERGAAIMSALASKHRINIVRHLYEREIACSDPGHCDTTERCCDVAELATSVECSMPTLSYHLKELRQVGLISAERSGRHIYYTLNLALLRATLQLLFKEEP